MAIPAPHEPSTQITTYALPLVTCAHCCQSNYEKVEVVAALALQELGVGFECIFKIYSYSVLQLEKLSQVYFLLVLTSELR